MSPIPPKAGARRIDPAELKIRINFGIAHLLTQGDGCGQFMLDLISATPLVIDKIVVGGIADVCVGGHPVIGVVAGGCPPRVWMRKIRSRP